MGLAGEAVRDKECRGIVGFSDQYHLMLTYPRGTFVIADLAGHYLPFEQPELLRSAAQEWLRRCDEPTTAPD